MNTPGKSAPGLSAKDEPFSKRTEVGGHSASSSKNASSVADVAREQLSEVRDAAGTLSEDAKRTASDFAASLKDKARDVAEEQMARGSDQIDGVANAIHGVADDLGKQMPAAAGYVREAAKGVEQFSSSLRNKSVDDLLDSAYHFARSQPLAFFGASVLAGFAISRFLKSSADRRDTSGRTSVAHRPSNSMQNDSGLRSGGNATGMGSQQQGKMHPAGTGRL